MDIDAGNQNQDSASKDAKASALPFACSTPYEAEIEFLPWPEGRYVMIKFLTTHGTNENIDLSIVGIYGWGGRNQKESREVGGRWNRLTRKPMVHPQMLSSIYTSSGWVCDGRDFPGGCRSKQVDFHQTSIYTVTFRNIHTGVDLCERCARDGRLGLVNAEVAKDDIAAMMTVYSEKGGDLNSADIHVSRLAAVRIMRAIRRNWRYVLPFYIQQGLLSSIMLVLRKVDDIQMALEEGNYRLVSGSSNQNQGAGNKPKSAAAKAAAAAPPPAAGGDGGDAPPPKSRAQGAAACESQKKVLRLIMHTLLVEISHIVYNGHRGDLHPDDLVYFRREDGSWGEGRFLRFEKRALKRIREGGLVSGSPHDSDAFLSGISGDVSSNPASSCDELLTAQNKSSGNVNTVLNNASKNSLVPASLSQTKESNIVLTPAQAAIQEIRDTFDEEPELLVIQDLSNGKVVNSKGLNSGGKDGGACGSSGDRPSVTQGAKAKIIDGISAALKSASSLMGGQGSEDASEGKDGPGADSVNADKDCTAKTEGGTDNSATARSSYSGSRAPGAKEESSPGKGKDSTCKKDNESKKSKEKPKKEKKSKRAKGDQKHNKYSSSSDKYDADNPLNVNQNLIYLSGVDVWKRPFIDLPDDSGLGYGTTAVMAAAQHATSTGTATLSGIDFDFLDAMSSSGGAGSALAEMLNQQQKNYIREAKEKDKEKKGDSKNKDKDTNSNPFIPTLHLLDEIRKGSGASVEVVDKILPVCDLLAMNGEGCTLFYFAVMEGCPEEVRRSWGVLNLGFEKLYFDFLYW